MADREAAALVKLFNGAIELLEAARLGRRCAPDVRASLLRLDVLALRLSRWAASVGVGGDIGSHEAGMMRDLAFHNQQELERTREILDDLVSMLSQAQSRSFQYASRYADARADPALDVLDMEREDEGSNRATNGHKGAEVNGSPIGAIPTGRDIHRTVWELCRRRKGDLVAAMAMDDIDEDDEDEEDDDGEDSDATKICDGNGRKRGGSSSNGNNGAKAKIKRKKRSLPWALYDQRQYAWFAQSLKHFVDELTAIEAPQQEKREVERRQRQLADAEVSALSPSAAHLRTLRAIVDQDDDRILSSAIARKIQSSHGTPLSQHIVDNHGTVICGVYLNETVNYSWQYK